MPDNSLNYQNITPVSEERLTVINELLINANIAIPMSMAYIRKVQGWDFNQLEKRFHGISKSTFQCYLQPSYQKIRPLHIIAAYSWLTMMPMACLYYGLRIKEAYPNMDDTSTECLIHSGLLPTNQFKLVISHLHDYLSVEDQEKANIGINAITKKYGSLEDYDDSDYFFPQKLDIKKFGTDYYRSLAIGCKKVRQENNISANTMAKIVGLSPYRYQRLEDPENLTLLPVELGAKLQMGLGLDNAMLFTANMKTYSQFHTVRKLQLIRQSLLIELMKHLDNKNKKFFSSMVLNLSSMYLNTP